MKGHANTIAQPQEQFLTRQDLSVRWRLSQETIKRREARQVLRAFKFGRAVRYKLSDILKIEAETALR